MARDTIVDRFVQNSKQYANEPALYYRREENWDSMDWHAYVQRARDFGAALLAEGYQPGDAVAIMGNNCPEWVIADLGAMMIRGVPAGIYQTSTPEQAAYVAGHCDAKVIVVESRAHWAKIDAQRSALPKLKKIVMIREADSVKDAITVSFNEFCNGAREKLPEVEQRFQALQDDDLATLIYTSGTTGPPKGAMLSHKNLAFAAQAAVLANDLHEAVVVSYLPLSHIAEQMITIHVAITVHATVWFAEALEKLREVLVIARPTALMGVPRVWEKLKTALETRFNAATGVQARIIRWARDIGLRAGYHRIEHGPPTGILAMQEKLAHRLFFSKVAKQIGLDRLQLAVTGAAPIGRDVLEFFLSIGIPLREVYGQTEACGTTTYNQPRRGKTRIGTVGVPIPNVEVKIAEDGEILVKADCVFIGYFKDETATKATLLDGYLCTGDIGQIDADGFLRITDRKKDLIITSGGKNVAPQNIEKLLRNIDGVSQAVVIGDRRKFLTALLTIDSDKGAALAKSHGWPADSEKLAEDPAFAAHVQTGINKINGQLARYESIKKFVVLPKDFTLETGELTPTQKIKRRVVLDKYSQQIEGMYLETGGIAEA